MLEGVSPKDSETFSVGLDKEQDPGGGRAARTL